MKRFAKAGTLVLLVLSITAIVMLPAGAAEEPTARCDEGHWPATVQGKPSTFEPGGRAGYYVWHDSRGWHLRTTTPQHTPHHFTGTIVSADDIKIVHQHRDEGRDTVTINGNRLSFSLVTYDGVDGIDFKVGCTESLSFSLKAGDRIVPATRIWLGRYGHTPRNPFTVKRAA